MEASPNWPRSMPPTGHQMSGHQAGLDKSEALRVALPRAFGGADAGAH